MNPLIFNATDPIAILNFLPAFKTACDTNGIHEGAAIWIFHFSLRDPARVAPTARTVNKSSWTSNKSSRDTSKLTTYCEVVQYLLRTYSTDDIIAEVEASLMRFTQGDRMNETDYAQALWTKALRCGTVYSEEHLKGLFIEGLHEPVRKNVQSYWAELPEADLMVLARFSTSVASLRRNNRAQVGDNSKNTSDKSTAMMIETLSTTADHQKSDQETLMNELLLFNSGSTATDGSSSTATLDRSEHCRVCMAV